MPTYEYRCRDCGREFEVFQRMSDEPGAPCPACNATAERLISGGAGLLFKGDGFYITDYRSDDYRKKAREEAGVGADKGDGSSGSDSKSSPETAKAASGNGGAGAKSTSASSGGGSGDESG